MRPRVLSRVHKVSPFDNKFAYVCRAMMVSRARSRIPDSWIRICRYIFAWAEAEQVIIALLSLEQHHFSALGKGSRQILNLTYFPVTRK